MQIDSTFQWRALCSPFFFQSHLVLRAKDIFVKHRSPQTEGFALPFNTFHSNGRTNKILLSLSLKMTISTFQALLIFQIDYIAPKFCTKPIMTRLTFQANIHSTRLCLISIKYKCQRYSSPVARWWYSFVQRNLLLTFYLLFLHQLLISLLSTFSLFFLISILQSLPPEK